MFIKQEEREKLQQLLQDNVLLSIDRDTYKEKHNQYKFFLH